ncbi:GntR family transcriptional regulator [Peribacillus sp. NPDC097295]|uniref:GntR family transcriptional regulator n=1 Tax=Peribacillus sp. NPDC097295 TaxID=3364402 RepID=UPI003818085A
MLKTKNKVTALHSAVKESIVHMIKNGDYQPNTKLPTEAEFCNSYDVSRTTVRTALQQLTMEGYVYRIQGKGTFVSENKVRQTLTSTVENFSDQVMMQGKNPSTKVFSLTVIEADASLAKRFNLQIGDPVNKLVRVRYVDDVPLQYEVAYLPWHRTPGLDMKACETSLFRLLKHQFNIKILKTIEHLELALADEYIAEKLDITNDSPCFSLETHTYETDQSVIEYSKTYFRGDRANFVIERNYED